MPYAIWVMHEGKKERRTKEKFSCSIFSTLRNVSNRTTMVFVCKCLICTALLCLSFSFSCTLCRGRYFESALSVHRKYYCTSWCVHMSSLDPHDSMYILWPVVNTVSVTLWKNSFCKVCVKLFTKGLLQTTLMLWLWPMIANNLKEQNLFAILCHLS